MDLCISSVKQPSKAKTGESPTHITSDTDRMLLALWAGLVESRCMMMPHCVSSISPHTPCGARQCVYLLSSVQRKHLYIDIRFKSMILPVFTPLPVCGQLKHTPMVDVQPGHWSGWTNVSPVRNSSGSRHNYEVYSGSGCRPKKCTVPGT